MPLAGTIKNDNVGSGRRMALPRKKVRKVRKLNRGISEADFARNYLSIHNRMPPEERAINFDDLFTYFVNNVVPDPDYALRQDRAIYEKMMRDPEIFADQRIRALAVAGLDWKINPGHKPNEKPTEIDKHIAKDVEYSLTEVPRLNESFENMQMAILKGMSVTGMTWKYVRGKWTYNYFYPVNKDRFCWTIKGQLRKLTRSSPVWGVPVVPYSFIPHVFNLDDGSFRNTSEAGYVFYGRGLADVLYHIFFFKTHALRFWLMWLERYGIPTKVGTYTPPDDATMRNLMLNILKDIRNNTEIALPAGDGWKIDFLESADMGRRSFTEFVEEYCDKKIKLVYLGQTLTSGTDGVGSLALGRVHENTFGRIILFDAQCLEDTLTTYLVKAFVDINYGKQRWYPKFKFMFKEEKDVAAFVNIITQLSNVGIEISKQQVREYCSLDEPIDEDDVVPTGREEGEGQQTTGMGSIVPQ